MWRLVLKILALLAGGIAAAFQIFSVAFILYDLFHSGRIGFASAFGYGVASYFSIPSYVLWLVLTRFVNVGFRTRLPNYVYLSSHVFNFLLMMLFPGKFGA